MSRASLAAGLALALALAHPLSAQTAASRPEVRLDAFGGRAPSLQVGVGVAAPAGTYVRLAAISAVGAAWHHGATGAAGRIDLLGRFLLDPGREMRYGLYGAGGLSLRYDAFEQWRPLLTASLGLEGPPIHRAAWSAELGLGGGVHLAVVVRPTRRGGR